MTVFRAGFSERVFEFGFNSEYADLNRAILAAAPDIPTQNEEKSLGYDVLFEIQQAGGVVHSIALQHKTCRFVDNEAPSNRHFWSAAGGAYFAFPVHVEQFNAMESIASSGLNGVEFTYCVPLFSTRAKMDIHYLANTVMTHSVWINPQGADTITDDDSHSIIVSSTGTKAFLFSPEPKELRTTPPRRRDKQHDPETRVELPRLYETVYGALSDVVGRERRRRHSGDESEFHMPSRLPPFLRSQQEGEVVQALAELFSKYLGVSWLVELPL